MLKSLSRLLENHLRISKILCSGSGTSTDQRCCCSLEAVYPSSYGRDQTCISVKGSYWFTSSCCFSSSYLRWGWCKCHLYSHRTSLVHMTLMTSETFVRSLTLYPTDLLSCVKNSFWWVSNSWSPPRWCRYSSAYRKDAWWCSITTFIWLLCLSWYGTLVEVNSAPEMKRALAIGSKLIGVNNRDLHSFSVDLNTTSSLVSLVPEGTVLAALSGISGNADVRKYYKEGVSAILVGEALMKASSTKDFIKELLRV